MIAGVNEGGPADAAKIRNGDVILRFNNQDVKEMRTLPRIVAETEIGKQVPVVLWRDGKETTVQASVGELPEEVQQASTNARPERAAPPSRSAEISGLGLRLSPLTDALRSQYSLAQDQKGVVVTEVVPDGTAAGRGLKPGDVIVEVQQEAVYTPADVQERVERFRKQNRRTVLMLIQSGEGLRWVPVPLQGGAQRAPG